MSAQISVKDLTKRHGRTLAVNGLGFEVRRGEIFGLLGANGAGKTTTLECLAGLQRPDAGELHIAGVDVVREPRAASARLGAVLQRIDLPDKLTPREALGMFGAFYPRRADASRLLERFKLTDKADAPYGTLSGGQKQRLALALAFVNEPEVVLMDEPAVGLDPRAREEFHAALLSLRAEGHTVLISTHDLNEAEKLCDRVAVIHEGRLIATGTPRELLARNTNDAQSIRLCSRPALQAEQLRGLAAVQHVSSEGEVWLIKTLDATATIAAIGNVLVSNRAELLELTLNPPSLERTYFDLLRGAPREGNP